MRIAIDTNRYVDFCRGEERAVEIFRSAGEICLPLFVIAELRAGFRAGAKGRENEKFLIQFLNSPRVEVLSPDDQTTHHYAGLFVQLRKQGTPIPTNDLWIAALAVQQQLANVQLQLEEARGRLQYLDNQVAFATISLAIHEALVPVAKSDEGGFGIVEAWKKAANGFLAVVGWTLVVIATAAPLILLLVLLWFLARSAARRKWRVSARATRYSSCLRLGTTPRPPNRLSSKHGEYRKAHAVR